LVGRLLEPLAAQLALQRVVKLLHDAVAHQHECSVGQQRCDLGKVTLPEGQEAAKIGDLGQGAERHHSPPSASKRWGLSSRAQQNAQGTRGRACGAVGGRVGCCEQVHFDHAVLRQVFRVDVRRFQSLRRGPLLAGRCREARRRAVGRLHHVVVLSHETVATHAAAGPVDPWLRRQLDPVGLEGLQLGRALQRGARRWRWRRRRRP
jgi:hypothetical protein